MNLINQFVGLEWTAQCNINMKTNRWAWGTNIFSSPFMWIKQVIILVIYLGLDIGVILMRFGEHFISKQLEHFWDIRDQTTCQNICWSLPISYISHSYPLSLFTCFSKRQHNTHFVFVHSFLSNPWRGLPPFIREAHNVVIQKNWLNYYLEQWLFPI